MSRYYLREMVKRVEIRSVSPFWVKDNAIYRYTETTSFYPSGCINLSCTGLYRLYVGQMPNC